MDSSKKLELLMELGRKLFKEDKLSEILKLYIDYVKLLLECERCTLFLYDKEKEEVTSIAVHGGSDIVAPASKGIVGMTIISKQTQFTNDAYGDFRFNKEIDKTTGYLTKQILSVPILNKENEVLGVLQALNSKQGGFTDDDVEFLEFLANYSSLGIENHILKDKIK